MQRDNGSGASGPSASTAPSGPPASHSLAPSAAHGMQATRADQAGPRPRTKAINRPGTWFAGPSFKANNTSASTSTCSNQSTTLGSPSPFAVPPNSFRSPFPSSKGKHKLSPSPSPRHEDDFVMISPVRPPRFSFGSASRTSYSPSCMRDDGRSSSPLDESPTPACGVASATARLKLVDDDSPIRRVPGQSRSLRGAIDDGERGIFLSAGGKMAGAMPPSPLKHASTSSTGGLFTLAGQEDNDDSPVLPPTPLLGSGPPPPPPQPLFPTLRTSQSQDCQMPSNKPLFTGESRGESRIPRLSTSHPLRARSSTDSERPTTLGSKKAVSLDAIAAAATKDDDEDEPFGHPITNLGKKSRHSSSSSMSLGGMHRGQRAHKRINSGEQLSVAGSISRSAGQKSGLALGLGISHSPGLGHIPDFASNSSLSSLSSNGGHATPNSVYSPAEPPIFEDAKPLAEVFDQGTAVVRKFKPRDSGVSLGSTDEEIKPMVPPPSVMKPGPRARRPPALKRTSSLGNERAEIETPSVEPGAHSGWPGAAPTTTTTQPFDFLGETGVGLGFNAGKEKPAMPGTPVKKHAYGHSHGGGPFGHRVSSQGSLAAEAAAPLEESTKTNMPPPTVKKPPPSAFKVPHLMLTGTSSPDSSMETDQSSPTTHVSATTNNSLTCAPPPSRVGLLHRQNSGGASESDGEPTPTKGGGGERHSLAPVAERPDLKTPTPSPARTKLPPAANGGIMPRLSLPAFTAPKLHRTLHHRQSHPAGPTGQAEEDEFEKRFITLETLGKGAFSTVLKVQDRHGDGLYAVKKARGVFDGVKDRLRHLEEVDILRHLSKNPCPHVIKFEDAWEQNRQLYIQTELCLGSLSFFLEEYGRVVERLDEGRVWKIVRELSDGINHIHSSGVIHFDIKPANILISSTGSLKIGDFGLATRWPRVSPAEILHGSGLGGVVPPDSRREKLEREGDRVYMPPEMLRGVFVMAADIFSFGLVILEVSTNICVPDGGAPWQALRTNDFSVVDLSPLSPALTELIVQCMAPDPACRPSIGHVVAHPIVQRARSGKDALAPEDPRWLAEILTGSTGLVGTRSTGMLDGDVEMGE